MIRAPHVAQVAFTPPPAFRETPQSLAGLSGSAVADRFCAWAGRSGRRYIFSVFAVGPQATAASLPLACSAIALMVRRPAAGSRRVLWAERIETDDELAAIQRAAASTAQAGPEGSEIHLHVLSAGAAARQAMVADLALPRLETGEPCGTRLRLAG